MYTETDCWHYFNLHTFKLKTHKLTERTLTHNLTFHILSVHVNDFNIVVHIACVDGISCTCMQILQKHILKKKVHLFHNALYTAFVLYNLL